MDINEKEAYELYSKGGYELVIDSVNQGLLKYDKWGLCEPCDSKQPIYKGNCLSCGNQYKIQTKEVKVPNIHRRGYITKKEK